jgi:hypothetical protein
VGKGAVYVVLFILACAVVAALGRGAQVLARRWLARHREHRIETLTATTPWSHYVRINKAGEYGIGVHRATVYRGQLMLFDGPIEMFKLDADESALNIEDKTNLARDKAAFNNNLKANSTDV